MQPLLPVELSDPARLGAVRATGLLDTGPEEAFDRLARLAAVVLGAPRAFVTIVDERRSFWKACIGVDLELEGRENPVEQSFCQYVIGSREPLVVGDARTDPRTRDNPSVELMGIVAWAGYPVHSDDGHILGTFCVCDTRPREWSPRDLMVLDTLASAASGEVALRVAVDRERSAQEGAVALARTLQESLMPAVLPAVPGLELAARFSPGGEGAEVLGDFYDVFGLGGGAWAVVVGDVCGSGVEAAKLTALARYTLRAAAMGSMAPSVTLAVLNEAMLRHDPSDARFLTAAYAVVEPSNDGADVRLSLAGHPPPLLRRPDGRVETVGSAGTLLGTTHAVDLVDVSFRLHAGETLLLYTDGLPEARDADGDFFGDARLAAALAAAGPSAAQAAEGVMEVALDHVGDGRQDDMAVLALRPG